MSVQRRSSPEDEPPIEGAEVFRFLRPRETDLPVERFLISDEGAAAMDEVYESIDESGNIIKTLAFEISVARRFNRSTIFTLFQDEVGGEGLTSRLELIDLYKTNPLVNATLAAVQRKHHKGDFQAKHLYSYGLRVFMNVVRYEWLQRVYDPNDPLWEDRARRLGDYQGTKTKMHLQPGRNRQDVIERNSPSDYLELS